MKKKYKILIGVAIVTVVGLSLFLGLFFGIPRLSYTYDKKHEGYIVTKAYGNASSYLVPDEVNNIKVVGIGERAFYNRSNLETIEFEKPQNIKIIKRLAFSRCSNLENIDITYATIIELSAFSYCSSLKDIKTNASSIGGSAFFKCVNVDNVEIPKVKYLGSMAFGYTNISSVNLPFSLLKIGIDAFYKCDNLIIITAPKALSDDSYLLSLGNIVEFI